MIPAIIPKQKIVFLGDQGVGKTSIINRFLYEKFDNAEKPTIGIDFITRPVVIQGKTIKLQLWDTAGQERFHSLIPSYIRDSNIAIMVYDITQKQSFLSINKWQEEVKNIRGKEILLVMVGNKLDLEPQREVDRALAEQKSDELGAMFFEVSAKTGLNIAGMFEQIITCIPLNNTIMTTTHEVTSSNHFAANNPNNNSNMLLQAAEKSNISENVNTHSNRDSEVAGSPKKQEIEGIVAAPKPQKEEERIKLNSNGGKDKQTDDGEGGKRKGCC